MRALPQDQEAPVLSAGVFPFDGQILASTSPMILTDNYLQQPIVAGLGKPHQPLTDGIEPVLLVMDLTVVVADEEQAR